MTHESGPNPDAPGWGPPPQQGQPYGWQPQQPPWGQPPPGGYGSYYVPPQTDGKAIGALVSAILSFVVCPLAPAIVALVLASQSDQEIAASQGRLTGEGFNTAARITAWVNIALSIVGGLFFLILLASVP